MELSYERHYQTSVPLLKSDEQLIEILEDHQVNIQIIHYPPLFVSFSVFFCFCFFQDVAATAPLEIVLKKKKKQKALIVKC